MCLYHHHWQQFSILLYLYTFTLHIFFLQHSKSVRHLCYKHQWCFGYLFGMDVAEKNVWEVKKCHPNQIIITQSTPHLPLFITYMQKWCEIWNGIILFYFIFLPFDDSKLCDKSVNFFMSQPKVPCRCYDDGGPEAHDRILTQFYGVHLLIIFCACLSNYPTSHKVEHHIVVKKILFHKHFHLVFLFLRNVLGKFLLDDW